MCTVRFLSKIPTPKPATILTMVGVTCLLLLIVGWQASLWQTDLKRLATYGRRDASGFFHDNGWRFFYFQYYLGYLPLTTPNIPDKVVYSRQGARDQVTEHGHLLVMEDASFVRDAMMPGVYLYYPNGWMRGSARDPSLVPFNKAVFLVSLVALLLVLLRVGGLPLAVFTTLAFGSSPFLLYENCAVENIRGLAVSVTLCVLAINAFTLLETGFRPRRLLAPVATALLVSAAAQVRSELHVVCLCAAFLYLTAWRLRWRQRLALAATLIVAYTGAGIGWRDFFDWKFREAARVTADAGGYPLAVRRLHQHVFWHSVFIGLADFDSRGFYRWDDMMAYRYVVPMLNEKYGMNLVYKDGYFLENNADSRGVYKQRPEYMPHYGEICRDKVLHDIAADPAWYARIVAKRIGFFFHRTSPVWLAAGKWHLAVPWPGWLLLPCVAFLWWRRRWDLLRLVLFSLPVGASVILVYAEDGAAYSSVYHLFAFGVACHLLVTWLWRRREAKK